MQEEGKKVNPLKSCSNAVVNALEGGFYRLGVVIGTYPWIFILVCFLLLGIMVPGIPLRFYTENRGEKLWIASDATAISDKAFVDKYYPDPGRFSIMLLTGNNVLTPAFLRAMLEQDTKIKALNKTDYYQWDTICIRLGSACWSNSILELWSFDESVINALTQQDILDEINTATVSPVSNRQFSAADWLGDVTRDGNNKIASAKATKMMYWIKYNITIADGDEVDKRADDWEQGFLDIASASHPTFDATFYWAFRSFSDEGGSSIFGDVQLLSIGYMLIFIFVTVVLGRFNAVQHRVYCALAGILAVGIGLGIAIGLLSYCELMWTPLHSTLPFLLIGIGVDDMFVIVQALENLTEEEKKRSVPERIGLTLKHAGVAITVTSLTDILAFAAGAVTILPALKSFCAYCAIGIFFTFFCQTFFFVSCLALDNKRADSGRDACCCCYVHKDYTPNECSQKTIMQDVFGNVIAPTLTKLPVKIAVVVATIGLLALGISGSVLIEQEFDPMWFLAGDSYAIEYFDADDKYFPADGMASGHVFLGEVNYYDNWNTIQDLYRNVNNDEYINDNTVDCWYNEFSGYMNSTADSSVTTKLDSNKFPTNEANFYSVLDSYLNSAGSRFKRDLVFTDDTNTQLQASRFSYSHRTLEGSTEEIAAMDRMQELTLATGLGGDKCFAYSAFYLTYSTNKVIRNELYRNLGLAFLCVFVMTLLLIANFWTCILVGLCVIMTLVDVLGTAHFWGQTIDTVLAIQLIVGIGLAVDYSAHIGHCFMTVTGSRNDRMKRTMFAMGPAVFYGGFSTFLAFILLAASKSYIFKTFFKIFFCVVFYGLFHGLLFLPVILSWVGPSPYLSASESQEQDVSPSDKKVPLENGITGPNEKTTVNGDTPDNNHVTQGQANPAYTQDEPKNLTEDGKTRTSPRQSPQHSPTNKVSPEPKYVTVINV